MSKYETVFNDETPPDMYDLGIETGKEWEQERILKVLNSQRDSGSHDAENDFINDLLDELSTLIKGEK